MGAIASVTTGSTMLSFPFVNTENSREKNRFTLSTMVLKMFANSFSLFCPVLHTLMYSEDFSMEGNNGAGKGDSYRPVDYQKWSANWDAIFGKKEPKKKPAKKKAK